MVTQPPSDEEPMPAVPDLDPEADQAIAGLLGAQPPLVMPAPVRCRILAALTRESATRAVLLGNDADLNPPADTFTKTVTHQPTPVSDPDPTSRPSAS